VSNNGNSGSGITGVLGIQNITSNNDLTVTGNNFVSLTFPQLLYIGSALTLTTNKFASSVSFPTSFAAAVAANVQGNTANLIDLSGLVTAPIVSISGNTGTGNTPTIKFAQLYNAPQIGITSNTGFTDFILGGLGFIGSLGSNNQNSISYTVAAQNSDYTLNIDSNPDVQRVRTYAANNNGWSAQAISIANNNALTTIDLTGLAQTAYLNLAASSTNVLANTTANDLTCAGQVTITAGTGSNAANNKLRSTSFSKLTRATYFNIPQATNSGVCSSTFASSVGSIDCSNACATCSSTATTSCNGGSSTLTTLICAGSSPNTANPLTASSTCVAPTYVTPTYSGQTLTPNTVPATSNGNSGTGSNNNGNTGTGSNNNNNSGTGTNNNGSGSRSATNTGTNNGNTGNGNIGDASTMVMSVAVMVAAALFFM